MLLSNISLQKLQCPNKGQLDRAYLPHLSVGQTLGSSAVVSAASGKNGCVDLTALRHSLLLLLQGPLLNE